MAAAAAGGAGGAAASPEETLKPFHKRALEAEVHAHLLVSCDRSSITESERLAKLEALLFKKDCLHNGSEENSFAMKDLQSKLEMANAECVAEKEKNKKLIMENEKLHYRISHLIRAVKEADSKRESLQS